MRYVLFCLVLLQLREAAPQLGQCISCTFICSLERLESRLSCSTMHVSELTNMLKVRTMKTYAVYRFLLDLAKK